MRIIRILEYSGDKNWIEETLAKSWVKGPRKVARGEVRSYTLTEYQSRMISPILYDIDKDEE